MEVLALEVQIPSTLKSQARWHMPVTPVLGAEAGGRLSGLPSQLIQPISDLQVQRDPVSKMKSVIKVDTHVHAHT